jgi:hypothetical protein
MSSTNTGPQPHRFTPGSLTDRERDQAEALGREAGRRLSAAQVRGCARASPRWCASWKRSGCARPA